MFEKVLMDQKPTRDGPRVRSGLQNVGKVHISLQGQTIACTVNKAINLAFNQRCRQKNAARKTNWCIMVLHPLPFNPSLAGEKWEQPNDCQRSPTCKHTLANKHMRSYTHYLQPENDAGNVMTTLVLANKCGTSGHGSKTHFCVCAYVFSATGSWQYGNNSILVLSTNTTKLWLVSCHWQCPLCLLTNSHTQESKKEKFDNLTKSSPQIMLQAWL